MDLYSDLHQRNFNMWNESDTIKNGRRFPDLLISRCYLIFLILTKDCLRFIQKLLQEYLTIQVPISIYIICLLHKNVEPTISPGQRFPMKQTFIFLRLVSLTLLCSISAMKHLGKRYRVGRGVQDSNFTRF